MDEDDSRISLGQLEGAILTYEKPDGTKVTVDFDEDKSNLQPSEDDNLGIQIPDDYKTFSR